MRAEKFRTLRFQITVIFTVLIFLFLAAILLINQFFLEDYYISQKEAVLKKSFTKLEYLSENEEITDDWMKDSSEQNLSWVVLNPEGTVIGGVGEKDMLASRLFGYLYGIEKKKVETKVLEKTKHYVVQKSKDNFVGMDYVEIWGQLDNENYCIIRTPLESIRESVNVSKGFYFYVALGVLVFSFLLIAVLTRRITEPISQLTGLSKRMAQLDFGVKYEGRAGNEIDMLGENFNLMSGQLQSTVSELKEANGQLQRDIEEKIRIDEKRIEFLNNVSHELKTPIALVQGYAEGLR
ncbi:MAG: HAMP domain-containing protein, partial [Blautia sp.]